jgi:1,2-diacylglycerol 3-beta-glucosyltransferase
MLITAASTALVLIMGSYLVLTILLASKQRPVPDHAPPDLSWVIVVPALNEERVIANTLDSLVAVEDDRLRVLVVDDGSDDATAAIVATYPPERVWMLSRQLPNARQGKGRALNEAYHLIRQQVLAAGVDPMTVIVGIVDGDGRLDPDVTAQVGRYFADPSVGAVQVRVRIYNRLDSWWARFQDYEFLTFSSITQRAREHIGSVGLGGNGQFTRLGALCELGEEPWTDCLTEDLDLGIRLAMHGWDNRFTIATEVRQQGLSKPTAIVRQRSRWMQGHLQCWRYIRPLVRSALPTTAVLDLLWYLAAPALSLIVSVVVAAAALIILIGLPDLLTRLPDLTVWWFLPVYLISFAPALFFALFYRRQAGDLSLPRALVLAQLLPAYNVVWYVATWWALGRTVLRRKAWTKTARTPDAILPDAHTGLTT